MREICYMTELVFMCVRKITHADWLLNRLKFFDIESTQYAFLSGPVRFEEKIFQLILIKISKTSVEIYRNTNGRL